LIDDEVGRFFCLHLPFWGFIIYVIWHLLEYLGLYIIWAGAVFVVAPYIVAVVMHGIHNQDKFEYYEGPVTLFRFTLAGYLVSILALIGIPGWYFGYLMQALGRQAFIDFYWNVIVLWYRVFNFYHGFSPQSLKEFANGYIFKYPNWQWSFLLSSVVIVPGIFYWLYSQAQEKARIEEKERQRLEAKTEQMRLRDEAREKDLAARQLAYEERQKLELEIEKEKQRELQAKINEIKGKDPWDSGFL
jgi:hypothetical protein